MPELTFCHQRVQPGDVCLLARHEMSKVMVHIGKVYPVVTTTVNSILQPPLIFCVCRLQ